MKAGFKVYNKSQERQEMSCYICFLMNLATFFFAHHKTHNISKLQFLLNKYKYGTYLMLMLGSFGHFGILSSKQLNIKNYLLQSTIKHFQKYSE